MVSAPKNYNEHIDMESIEYKLAAVPEFIILIDKAKEDGFVFAGFEPFSDKDHVLVNFKKKGFHIKQYTFNFIDYSYELIKSLK
jgi:hypothetical protein